MGAHPAAIVALDHGFNSGGFKCSLRNLGFEIVDIGSYDNKPGVGNGAFLGGYSLAEMALCRYLF